MSFIRTTLRKLARDEKGATAIEYGLIAALIAVVCIAGLSAVGSSLKNTLNTVSSELDSANNSATTTTP
ncbi:Flp family type IVb pilin [Pedomonas mirosovicensis]|uniref:Flp family type IVb pilin n=1 Tax=Pedomonas mirosovicensis TaxID=2908641 RepID=UPI002168CBB5|nr:Flp family type IVb pilin [Pedomonas mirosovicensis]MCH8685788.1 Flp family type IVb pilin [Pedomonas mirosovicensis]